jgi:uncharacterized protein YndB with AHSA1/START domain
MEPVEYKVLINASPTRVWDALTHLDRMKRWMAEPEINIDVMTDWTVGGPIVITGFHHVPVENKGTVLQFDPPNVLQYNHLSSLSRLPDKPENQTSIEFRLVPENDHTALTITLSNFPTESIFRHLDFYWRVTVGILKKYIEQQQD